MKFDLFLVQKKNRFHFSLSADDDAYVFFTTWSLVDYVIQATQQQNSFNLLSFLLAHIKRDILLARFHSPSSQSWAWSSAPSSLSNMKVSHWSEDQPARELGIRTFLTRFFLLSLRNGFPIDFLIDDNMCANRRKKTSTYFFAAAADLCLFLEWKITHKNGQSISGYFSSQSQRSQIFNNYVWPQKALEKLPHTTAGLRDMEKNASNFLSHFPDDDQRARG